MGVQPASQSSVWAVDGLMSLWPQAARCGVYETFPLFMASRSQAYRETYADIMTTRVFEHASHRQDKCITGCTLTQGYASI